MKTIPFKNKFITVGVAAALMMTGCTNHSSLLAAGKEEPQEERTGAVKEAKAPVQVYLSDIKGHWGEQSIQQAIEAGYVDGYEDGTFRPDSDITRAEYVTMVTKAMGLNPLKKNSDDQWYDPYISAVVNAGYHRYSDFNNGTWDTPITRLEMARIAVRASNEERQSADNQTSDEELMFLATKTGMITGMADGQLGKEETATRAQSVTIIQRILDLKEGKELEVDKRAASYAEVEWRNTNMESILGVLPEEFPMDLSYGAEVDVTLKQVLVVDMEDPDAAFRSWFPKVIKKYDASESINDYLIAMELTFSNNTLREGYWDSSQYFGAGYHFNEAIIDPDVQEQTHVKYIEMYSMKKHFNGSGWLLMTMSKTEVEDRISTGDFWIDISNRYEPQKGFNYLTKPMRE
ncbi:S-layer homology domain-containing protein [Paenibacillus residui]|uniref:S-layer homology domain-containing protein n=1 Tax=Paenibacillus residui TaxID=629724 RepID=A0ABW3DIR2_9BACL